MVSSMPSLEEGLKKYVLNSTKKLILSLHFFNVDSSFNIESKLKFAAFILHIVMQGTVPFLGLSVLYM